jgi:hypothetical protein
MTGTILITGIRRSPLLACDAQRHCATRPVSKQVANHPLLVRLPLVRRYDRDTLLAARYPAEPIRPVDTHTSPAPTAPSPFVALMATSHRRVLSLRILSACCDVSARHFSVKLSRRSVALLWGLIAPALVPFLLLVDPKAWNITLIFVADYGADISSIRLSPQKLDWTTGSR